MGSIWSLDLTLADLGKRILPKKSLLVFTIPLLYWISTMSWFSFYSIHAMRIITLFGLHLDQVALGSSCLVCSTSHLNEIVDFVTRVNTPKIKALFICLLEQTMPITSNHRDRHMLQPESKQRTLSSKYCGSAILRPVTSALFNNCFCLSICYDYNYDRNFPRDNSLERKLLKFYYEKQHSAIVNA